MLFLKGAAMGKLVSKPWLGLVWPGGGNQATGELPEDTAGHWLELR